MILALIVLVVFIEKCTVINILSSSLFKNKEYDNYAYLHEGVGNDNSKIVRISESPYNTIAYDEKGNHFIVYGDDKILKIDSRGVEKFSIPREDGVSFANLGSFVFTDTEVYDLSQKTVEKTKIKKIIHATDTQLTLKGFLNLLGDYYEKASIVIYANEGTFNTKNHKVYLKIADDWIGLYILKNASYAMDFHSSGEILKKFPKKSKSLLLLKNPVNNIYSTRSSGSESFSSVPDDLELTKEKEIEYPGNEKIHISFYQKEKTLGTIVYTSIPVSFKGTAYFDLNIGKNNYKFKEMGAKSVGFVSEVKHGISYYVLPKKDIKNSEVSFLKVFPASNMLETGSKGVYVVRPIN